MDWPFIEAVLGSWAARTIYVWGPPGTGKTYAGMHCGLRDREVFSLTLTPDTSAAELRGHWIPKGDRFEWMDGPLIHAMKNGFRLVINEIAFASHDVMAILHPLLENVETARLTLPNRETVVPAKGFQVVCTDNEPIEPAPGSAAGSLQQRGARLAPASRRAGRGCPKTFGRRRFAPSISKAVAPSASAAGWRCASSKASSTGRPRCARSSVSSAVTSSSAR